MPRSKLFIVPREPARRQRIPNNLPIQSTPLIGREKEVDDALRILGGANDRQSYARLLTLIGPGGVGKTRLALRVAKEILEEGEEGQFEQGIYFVELAPITDPELALPAIANILQAQETPGTPLISTLKQQLQNKRVLLVLDNFEQILPAGAMLADLLATCPDLTVLVTSRSPLRLRAEREFVVSPLDVPEARQHLSASGASEYGAVALFAQRARAINPDFELTNDNIDAVMEVCRKVDGLPLAIELVAAHIRLLSPQSILARLTNPLSLLRGREPETTSRHKTMRDTIEWSYNLLAEWEQELFRRLSIFVGGFSLRAAEAVCNAGDDIEISSDHPLAIEVLEGVETLVDSSLLRGLEAEEDGDRRLAMLATVREYAWEQLVANKEQHITERRHAAYFLSLAEQVNPNPATQEGLAWLGRLKPDLDNFRAALSWLLNANGTGTAVEALRLLKALQFYWERHTQHLELIALLARALTQIGSEAKPLQIWARRRGAIQAQRVDDFKLAGEWLAQALDMARELGDKSEIIECVNLQSRVAFGLGDYDLARSMMEEVLATSREVGNEFMVAATLINVVGVDQSQGKYEHAEKLSREGLSIFEKLGNRIGIMWALLNLGATLRHLGRFDEARADTLKSLALAQEADHPLAADILVLLGNLIMVEIDRASTKVAKHARVRQAVRIYGLAGGLLERRGSHMDELLQAEAEPNVRIARETLGEEAFNMAWEEGQSMEITRALELAARRFEPELEVEGEKPRGRGRPKKRTAGGLTDREADVVALVARGMTNPDIASRLVLSVRTVETHVANAMQKLGLRTRTELAAWAVSEGLVEGPSPEQVT